MRIILYPFVTIAAIGFVLSLATHLMALGGLPPPGGGLVWGLHIGIFTVWIPTVIISNRRTPGGECNRGWKTILSGCPLWMRRAVQVIFIYAFVNFLLFMITTIGQPKKFGPAPVSVLRGFSGYWMAFYSAAFSTLYSVIKGVTSPGN